MHLFEWVLNTPMINEINFLVLQDSVTNEANLPPLNN